MINYNFYPEDNFILTIFYGEISPRELHELIDKLQKIDHEEGAMRGLSILCKNTKSKGIKASDVMSAGERMHNVSFRKNGKHAIIAKTLLAYGLSRMYKVASDVMNLDELKVYKEEGLDDAIKWLDLSHLNELILEIVEHCEHGTPTEKPSASNQ